MENTRTYHVRNRRIWLEHFYLSLSIESYSKFYIHICYRYNKLFIPSNYLIGVVQCTLTCTTYSCLENVYALLVKFNFLEAYTKAQYVCSFSTSTIIFKTRKKHIFFIVMFHIFHFVQSECLQPISVDVVIQFKSFFLNTFEKKGIKYSWKKLLIHHEEGW